MESGTEDKPLTECPECGKQFDVAIWISHNKLGSLEIKELKTNNVLHNHISDLQQKKMQEGRARKRDAQLVDTID